ARKRLAPRGNYQRTDDGIGNRVVKKIAVLVRELINALFTQEVNEKIYVGHERKKDTYQNKDESDLRSREMRHNDRTNDPDADIQWHHVIISNLLESFL